jgi:glycogen operon protein
VRDFWRGEPSTVAELASRLTGSSDLYQADTRRPVASINFVTAHDGFTLRDLVSYNEKHNQANGEDNRDGENHNRSWNCGAEGPSDDPDVSRCRSSQQRNFLTTLFLSQGVPMLLGGDEMGRTQGGNNNPYAQDNEISWYDWANVDEDLLAFTRRLIALRQEHPIFRQRRWFQGRPIRGTVDISWFRSDGQEMSEEDFNTSHRRSLGMYLNGDGIRGRDLRGQPVTDDTFMVVMNANDRELDWKLPTNLEHNWSVVVDTSGVLEDGYEVDGALRLPARSTVVLTSAG